LKKIESIVRPHLLSAVTTALQRVGVTGMTATEVKGVGRQKGRREWRRGDESAGDFLPKAKIEALVPDHLADAAIDAVMIAAQTGKYGDGKVFVYSLDQSVGIDASERGEPAA
jgi:nitrogen regulatory protein P-II 1